MIELIMRTLEEQMKERGLESANFTEPWQARAFAIALALAERGSFEWEDFRQQLIVSTARADALAAQGSSIEDTTAVLPLPVPPSSHSEHSEESASSHFDPVSNSDYSTKLLSAVNTAAYYACWLEALEAAITGKSIARPQEIEQNASRIAAHPPAPTKAVGSGPIKIA
jgi:nitrile hydratase beta subunit-like protein